MAMVRRVVRDESVAPKLEIVEPHVGQGGLAALDIQLRQPGQLCNNLLHEFLVRVGLGESGYTSGSWAENRAFPERPAQVVREPIDDFDTPAFVVLSIQSVSSDAPVELDEFPVHGECGANLS